jgi:hypothetical protein
MFSIAQAAEVEPQNQFVPANSSDASWVFSGVVTSESGEKYGYYFQVRRDGNQFHAIAALLDEQSKSVVLLDESEAIIQDTLNYDWHIGHAFLRYKSINDSWIFGLKNKDKKGFNFKVDMAKEDDKAPVSQKLRDGVELLVSQTSRLNGHLQVGEGHLEQFVTAKNAWFRQIWLSEKQKTSHPFTGILCQFNDGSGFYSANMAEADAIRGAVAGWRDGEGVSAVMSQFINIKQTPEGPWHINIAAPDLHLVLSTFIQQNSIVAAGFVEEGKSPGFCMVSKEVVGALS